MEEESKPFVDKPGSKTVDLYEKSQKSTVFVDEVISKAQHIYKELDKLFESTSSHREILDRFQSVFMHLEYTLARTDLTLVSSNAKSDLLQILSFLGDFIDGRGFSDSELQVRLTGALDDLLDIQPRLTPLVSLQLFAEAQDRLDSEANVLQEALKKRTEAVTLSASEFRERISKEEDSVAEIVSRLRKLETEGEALSHYLSGRALEGFFADRANEEKTSAQKWTRATWGFASATVIVLVALLVGYYLGWFENNEINYGLLGTKALLIATLGFVAKWSSKRAHRHLDGESRYRRLAINMKTLDSFVASLQPESRERVLLEVALKTFTDGGSSDGATDFETPGVGDLLKTALEKVGK